MRLVLLGAPGAGKGTQANFIKERCKVPHISTGDIFRYHIKYKTPLGLEADKYIQKGLLVPDELTIKILEERLAQEDCKYGFLLDGFPRTVFQAETLSSFLAKNDLFLDLVLLLNVPECIILKRNIGRRICSKCALSYHLELSPPKVSGKCDVCNGDLIQRKDDCEDVLRERLNVYNKQTAPLIQYYSTKKLLADIDGSGDIKDIYLNIGKILDEFNKQ